MSAAPPSAAAPSTKTLNLALQGGGSHGAFTWGVLDALLEDGRLTFEGISGTSAGAMNAVALAHGFAVTQARRGTATEARELARSTLRRLWEGVGLMGSWLGMPQRLAESNPWLQTMAQMFSPYQSNPFNLNPLRDLVSRTVDFELLAKADGPKLFICATQVRNGKAEIFSGRRVSVDAVMASACLPMVFKAVEIEGKHYWDGGYSGNPALFPLIYETESSDVLLVQINPIHHVELPDDAREIVERMNEVTFNASLMSEMRAIEFVRRLLAEGRLDPARYKSMRMHRVDGGRVLEPFGAASKSQSDLPFLEQLFTLGRAQGERWLKAHFADVGVRPSIDIAKDY